MTEVAIVGAGPAGIAAAGVLVEAGLAPVVIDEAAEPGGQIWRRPAAATGFDLHHILGADADAHRAFHQNARQILARCDWRPATLAWGIEGKTLFCESAGRITEITADTLILATGAADRTFPVRGWTLPGVFSLGGAQVLLKGQGCLIGRRVVFAGASPLLYLAAKQYLAAGATVAAVIDTTPLATKVTAASDLIASAPTLWRGLGYMAAVARRGVPILMGRRIVAFEGGDGVEAVTVADRAGRVSRIACDAVAFGFGLKPETQLADLAGARFAYDASVRQWLPEIDSDGRAGPGLYLAGDGARIGGAEAAAASGRLVSAAALVDMGRAARVDLSRERRAVGRLGRFQRGLAKAFHWPAEWADGIADDVTVCRCEGVTAGEIRRTMTRPLGPVDVNRVKALTRVGMGRCQGRFCGLAATEIAAAAVGAPHASTGRLRGQSPVKPLGLAHPAAGAGGEAAEAAT